MISPIVQQAFDKCAVTVTFSIKDMHNGKGQTTWHSRMTPFTVTDPKTGKRYVVGCSVHLDNYRMDIEPRK
jgi:hypothetical protein